MNPEELLSETPPDALPIDEARGQADALRAEIRTHDRLYYVRGAPEISDALYDRLFRRLRDLEEAHPELRTPDSPTQRVGAEPVDSLPTVKHTAPLLSLDSTQDPDEVRRFHERVLKALGIEASEGTDDDQLPGFLLEPKLDGVSIELVYHDGALDRAVTRGNGREGEGVTENARTIPSVPLRLREPDSDDGALPLPPRLAVRGEILMRLSAFEALNERLMEEGNEPYANPRNATSGAVRQLDSQITASRPLECLAYDILDIEGVDLRSDSQGVEALRGWGFAVPERIERTTSLDDMLAYHARYDEDRDGLDYEIDGIVIKLDDLEDRVDLGSTSHHPRWALAYKFEPRKEVTRIDRIAIQVGRTGVLTPVALLRPVEVGGVTVSRATLHNREELERKDVREGDRVRIQRAGDVIPQVVEVVPEEGRERAEPFRMPERCPNCDTPVQERGPFTYCPNRFECVAQLKGRLVHFASRNGLDIEGLGEETAGLLVDRGLVHQPADLFGLDMDKIEALPGFAEVSATKLVEAIQRRRRTELRRFLYGLGIPEVGATVARDLAAHFRSLDALLEADREALEEVRGVGPTMSETIVGFLADERNRAAIDALHARMEELTVPERAGEGGPLEGQTFVFTGSLESMTRGAAKKRVEALGARATGSVSGETDVVVAGPGAGRKRAKAEELGVEILDEDGFLALLDEVDGD